VSRTSNLKVTNEFAADVLTLAAEANRRKGTPLGIEAAVAIEDAIVSIRNLLNLNERMYQVIVDHGLVDELGDQPPDNCF
jgi:uncharacterized protein (DUF1778 family)